MHHGMEKLHSLTARRYAEHLIYINAYLASFPGETLTDKIGVTDLNEIILNNMTNIWSKQAYLQGFDCEYITFKNLFTCLRVYKYLSLFMKVY